MMINVTIFQFQYGTIKSDKSVHDDKCHNISIPVWYDYKPLDFTLLCTTLLISIPVWYDYKPGDLE